MAKKGSYELIFERDLDDVQYKITKNNDVFYFEYKDKKNNDTFVKELTTSESLAEITPERQTDLYGSDKYKMYFNSYSLTENNFTRNIDYISIPSLDFYYSFDEYENDIGTFFLSTANLLDEEAEYAIKVMKAIADPKTIKEMPSLKILEITQFTFGVCQHSCRI